MKTLYIDGSSLRLSDVIDVAIRARRVEIEDKQLPMIEAARAFVEDAVRNRKVIYGLTTGFGKFSDVVIDEKDTEALQRNLIRSHACGVGAHLPKHIVRAIMLLRANALCKGFSGIRPSTIENLIQMINADVCPLIPEKGSLGSSGDLAPLSHMVLVMMGEGEALYRGEKMSGAEALKRAGIRPVTLSSKEGLALINGTQVQTAIGLFAAYEGLLLSRYADVIAALSFEALNGVTCALDNKIHEARGQRGQIETAANLLKLLEGSTYTTKQGELRVQDAYALRCAPQVHGACKDALAYVLEKIEIEINAATDNPLIFPEAANAISGGNFHGEPMALALDFLGIALAELANISERRTERLVNPALSNGLSAFLSPNGGLNSGFMIMQYSAASLVSENKVLAHPASVDSIPSSANQEDHVSMGTIAARKAYEIAKNLRSVLAIEYLSACQGIDLRGEGRLAKGTEVAYNRLRRAVATLEEDRIMYVDIEKAAEILADDGLIEEIEAAIAG